MADPWMKFYPNDWIGEPKLKLVSRAARSMWIDMLCLMHQAGTGRLEVSGRPMTEKELSAVLGDNPRTTRKLLSELADAGVSIIVDGSFVASSRMIEDFKKAERDKSNGRKGGNPALKTRETDHLGVNPEDKAQKPEARSQKPDKEEDKSSSSQEAVDYLNFLNAHPRSVETLAGERHFAALRESGVSASEIIGAAAAYANEVAGWSSEGKVQQSDNFLHPVRGKWREFRETADANEVTAMARDAERVRSHDVGQDGPMKFHPELAGVLISKGFLTETDARNAGINL